MTSTAGGSSSLVPAAGPVDNRTAAETAHILER